MNMKKVSTLTKGLLLSSLLCLNLSANNNFDALQAKDEEIIAEITEPKGPNASQVILKRDGDGLVFESIDNSKALKKKAELQKFKDENLILGQSCCFFDTHGEDPYLKIVRPDIDECNIIKCGCFDSELEKNRYKVSTEDFENLVPLQLETLGYGSNTKYKMKYQGERKSYAGKFIEKILPDTSYKGTILVDEVRTNVPMFWTLNNPAELSSIFTYLLKKFEDEGFYPTRKTLLVLKIKEDPKLEKISKADQEFLDTYFELFPLTDKEVKKFFETHKNLLKEVSFDMGGSNPKFVGESYSQSVARQIEKGYNDFKFKDTAIAATTFLAVSMIYNLIQDDVKGVFKRVHDWMLTRKPEHKETLTEQRLLQLIEEIRTINNNRTEPQSV